jgi:hypothetical protein
MKNTEARHRYSEFESLRESLSKLYPTLIVPPIPSKQTIGDYAVKQGKAKEDATLIARRKRLLQTFLNRLARHPILSNEHVFHRFLDGEVSWVSYSSRLEGWYIFAHFFFLDRGLEFSSPLFVAEEYIESSFA